MPEKHLVLILICTTLEDNFKFSKISEYVYFQPSLFIVDDLD